MKAWIPTVARVMIVVGMVAMTGCARMYPDARGAARGAAFVSAAAGNVCVVYSDGSLRRVTNSGRDHGPALAPDGKQVVFVRQVAEFADNPLGVPEDDAAMLYACWSPYEIWCADLDAGTVAVLLRSQYASGVDRKENRGWFYDLGFAPDGRTLYYACQPACPTTNAIRAVDRDGSNDRWLCWGQSVEVIDDDASDPYFGCLRVEYDEDGPYDIGVILSPGGHELARVREQVR